MGTAYAFVKTLSGSFFLHRLAAPHVPLQTRTNPDRVFYHAPDCGDFTLQF